MATLGGKSSRKPTPAMAAKVRATAKKQRTAAMKSTPKSPTTRGNMPGLMNSGNTLKSKARNSSKTTGTTRSTGKNLGRRGSY